MREQKFKRQVEEIECPNCGGFGAVHSIFRLNRTTVRHSIHCKWCDYSDWWNEERYEVKSKIATLMGKETNYERSINETNN